MNGEPGSVVDEDQQRRIWRLEAVADAARSLPMAQQSKRLQEALARLVDVPQPAARPADPPAPR